MFIFERLQETIFAIYFRFYKIILINSLLIFADNQTYIEITPRKPMV